MFGRPRCGHSNIFPIRYLPAQSYQSYQGNTRTRREICTKFTRKTPERRY